VTLKPTGDIFAMMSEAKMGHPNRAILLIGISKLLEAALLFVLAFGAHKLMHKDIGETVEHWARAVKVDPENKYVRALLTHTTGVSERRLEEISVGTFIYATLFTVEGIGLVLRKRWAEYVTVITTAGFLPIEVYEVIHKPHLARIVILSVNLLIVGYLIYQLYHTRKEVRVPAAVTP
jgi:uncharacterized membrane protein (DUF2068 family)